MGMLRRWLDPAAERKRLRRAMPRPRAGTDLEIGCLWPLALMLAVAIAAGVVLGMRVQPAAQTTPGGTSEAVVRVIDDGAAGGPKVLSTQVVPLR
jgi:hypothetical protein